MPQLRKFFEPFLFGLFLFGILKEETVFWHISYAWIGKFQTKFPLVIDYLVKKMPIYKTALPTLFSLPGYLLYFCLVHRKIFKQAPQI